MPPESATTPHAALVPRRSRGLRFRFLFWITIVLFCTLGGSAFYVYRVQQDQLERHMRAKTEAIGHFIALISPTAIYAFDITTMDRYMRQISNEEDVRFAQIRSAGGQPLTTYLPKGTRPEEVARWITQGLTRIKAENGLESTLEVYEFPIINGEDTIGWVEIGLDNKRIVLDTRNLIRNLILIFSVIVISLGTLIFFIFKYQVLHRIGALAQGAARAAAGKYDQRVSIHSNDELGLLARSFNGMLKEIKSDREALLRSNQRLAEEIGFRRLATDELKKLSLAVEQSPASVVITDLQGQIEYVNPKFCEVSGYSRDELLGRHTHLLDSPSEERGHDDYRNIWSKLQQGEVWKGEFCNHRKNGQPYWESAVIAPIRGEDDTITHYLAVKEDITERKAFEQRLLEQATHDQLTGLPNRFLAFDRLQQLLQFAERHHRQIAVIYIDIDNFKTVNDSLGHTAGDQLLIQVARQIKKQLRGEDTLARLGGDEFVALVAELHDTGNDLEMIITRLQGALQTPLQIEGREISVTSSLGIALYPENGRDVGTLMSNADMAMYEAKHAGRNTYRYFNSEINRRVAHNAAIETRLRQALDQAEFYPVYQPIVRLRDGALVGAEVLLRWQSRELGSIPPRDFIPVAEKTGHIKSTTGWLFEKIFSQAEQWPATPPGFWLAVNISPVYFRDIAFVTSLSHMVQRAAGLHMGLCMEITENLLLRSGDEVIDTFRKLQSLGIHTAMDDFGTGYSSLAYLKRFPLSFLKIDRTFIDGLPSDADDLSLTETIVLLGQKLGITLIAEGVETQEQMDCLKGLQVEYAQGYFFAQPLLNEEFSAYVARAC